MLKIACMKRVFLLFAVVVMAAFLAVYTSCRKSHSHPTNPTPDDYRLMSYTKVLSTVDLIVSLLVYKVLIHKCVAARND